MTNLQKTTLTALALVTSLGLGACSALGADEAPGSSSGGAAGRGAGGSGGTDDPIVLPGGNGGSGAGPGTGDPDVPRDCAEAASWGAYVGCDFWPTVTYNPLYREFDFAVVVANGSAREASLLVTGPGGLRKEAKVAPGGLASILVPWVDALKGPEFSRTTTEGGRVETSVRVDGGAYHLVSTEPVTAWQFNPLQYKKPIGEFAGCGTGFDSESCFSASNDASLLLPSSAMTGNYRVALRSEVNQGEGYASDAGAIALTATRDGTTVELAFPAGCGAETWNPPTLGDCVAAGAGVRAAKGGERVTLTMNAGDVVEFLGAWGAGWGLAHADLSGTVINASAPVQVIALNPITNLPATAGNADHLEETVLPGEALGKKYLVVPPTAPGGAPKGGHIVRLYGNVDGTALTYPEGKPSGAPGTLDAGQVVELGPLLAPFVVEGTAAFAVASFMLGGSEQGSGNCPNYPCSGDPAMSFIVTPEQFRKDYTFLAPVDYDTNFADILLPEGATATLDGKPLSGAATPIGASGWSVVRERLGAGQSGAHHLTTTDPRGLGLQVMGFGHATSYYYPGGMNLKHIAPPPEPPK